MSYFSDSKKPVLLINLAQVYCISINIYVFLYMYVYVYTFCDAFVAMCIR